MPYKVGDAVRLRDGSGWRRDDEPWTAEAGRVVAVLDEFDPPRLNVLYNDFGPLLSTVLASDFEPAPAVTPTP